MRRSSLLRQPSEIFDQSSFSKYEMTGPDAGKALDWICANDVSKPVGRLTYTQLLNTRGGIEADLTVARLAEEKYYIVTGTGFRTHDLGWIEDHILGGLEVSLADVTEDFGTLSLMGPKARDVLAAVTDADVSNTGFPFGHVREIRIADHTIRALRVTYVGELGWELHVPIAATGAVFDALMAAGAPHGIRPVGYRALESLRLEKGYRAWGSDITPNDTPFEAGLGFRVSFRKGDYLGRAALEKQKAEGVQRKLCTFTCDARVTFAGSEAIHHRGRVVGTTSSANWGHSVGKMIAFGYLPVELAGERDFEIEAYGERYAVERVDGPLYDPRNERLKA